MSDCCELPKAKEGHDNHDHKDHHQMMVEDYKKRFWISLFLSLPVLFFSEMIRGFFGIPDFGIPNEQTWALILASIVFFYGGWPFLKGLYSEVSSKKPGMMTLVAVAISAAFLYSMAVFFGLEGESLLWEMVTLVVIMLLGHWVEMKSILGATSALKKLAALMPNTANLVQGDGGVKQVAIKDLEVGDKVLIKPGEKVPVDGVVIDGRSSVNESMLTGEVKPVEKNLDDKVIGGSINNDGTLTVSIEKVGQDTYLSSILKMVNDAQSQKSKTQNLADRAARLLTFVALFAGFLTLVTWVNFSSFEFSYALQRTIAVIVIACPHALGLAIPLVVSFSTSISAKRGVLIRNREAFEAVRKVDTVIFDKTGTLTEGRFGVSDVLLLNKNLSKSELLDLAGSVEGFSEHPIAKAVAEEVKQKKVVENFKNLPGQGVEGLIDGQDIKVVSPNYLKSKNLFNPSNEMKEIIDQGKTVVFVLIDNELQGAIGLDDVVRKEAKEAISGLKDKGIEPVMLTGDAESVAFRVSEELGIEKYYAEVLPDKKSEKVKELQAEGKSIAMVGDGVNDAPALAQADVGIAIGAGTDVAIESAGIILVKNDPRDVEMIIGFSREVYKKMIQNLWWASGYNIVAIPLAAGVLFTYGIVLSPAFGAILMSVSTIVVALNATLLKIKNRKY